MRLLILCLVLFLSGSSALLFQTLWLRLCGLTFGNSVWSAALILCSFMGGLALGSGLAARIKLKGIRPLVFYAILELAVALFGGTIVFAIPHLGEWARPLFQSLWDQDAVLNGLRLLVAFLIFLVPATAMGMTLPVLLHDPVIRRYDFGAALGLLYGLNTLGAVGGALVGEAYLVKAAGLWGTGFVAGALSCAAAAIALLLTRFAIAGKTPESKNAPSRNDGESRAVRLLFISFGTGCILLSLEVIWFRFIRLYVASSPIAFSVMLAVVLIGIGVGGIIAAAIHRWKVRSANFVALLLVAAGLVTLLSYIFFPAPAATAVLGESYAEAWQQIGKLSFALMLPVCVLSGVLLPSIVTQFDAGRENRMSSTGVAIFFNTCGAVAGPLLASFLLLPRLGYQLSLVLCGIAYAVMALLAFDWSHWRLRKAETLGMAVLSLGFVSVLFLFPHQRDEEHFARARAPYESDGSRLITKIEGLSDTFQLLRQDFLGEPYYYRLVTNAFSMSSTHPRSQRYMRLFAHLPAMLRPESENALLICYGVGVTADALTRNAQLKQIDIVDISREVFSLADNYSSADHPNPLRDPRVNAFVQDGRFFLQAVPHQYDIITGEPPPLKVSGTVNLYTEEFFTLIRGRLKPGGIATFWLPIYQVKVEETKAILRAFYNAFPDASVWASSDREWIMMGRNGLPRAVTNEEATRLFRDSAIGVDLKRVGIHAPEELAALYIMDGPEIDRLTTGIAPLTDLYPKRLGDAPPVSEESHQLAWEYMEAGAAGRRFSSSTFVAQTWPEEIRRSIEAFFIIREMRYLSQTVGANWLAELDLYLRESSLRTPVLEVLNSDELRLSIAERVVARAGAPPPEALPDLVAGALARRDLAEAIRLLERKREHGIAADNDLSLLTYLYCLKGRTAEAEAVSKLQASAAKKDWFVEWLWTYLQALCNFSPPPSVAR